jgi:FkbM family methyltransferase
MKLKHWLRFLLTKDTTWHGQFDAMRPLLLEAAGVEPVVVDVGANDGFFSSNSYPFIRRGWRAVLIEPNPEACARAMRLHRRNKKVSVLNLACGEQPGRLPLILFDADEGGSQSTLSSAEPHPHADKRIQQTIMVEVVTLENLLGREHVPPNFGLLTIDTEGHDYFVILGLNLAHFRPQVIITENGPHDEDKCAHLMAHGYKLHRRLDWDAIWTRAR